jgi:hypothetical protein
MRFQLSRCRLHVQFVIVLAAVSITSATPRAALPAGNAVQQWNKIAEDIVVGSGAFQNEGLIYMAYVSAAVYDAVTAIQGGYEPYALDTAAHAVPPGASVDAAVAEAAYTVLYRYFEGQRASLNVLHQESLALISDGPAKEAGKGVGLAAAQAVISLRHHDGLVTPIGSTSSFPLLTPGPGVWRLTPPGFAAPQTPWVGSVRPFVMNEPGQFHPHPPPPLSSQRWVDEFNEVQLYGSAGSAARTAAQTAVARFWTANVIRQYNGLGRELATARALSLLRTARLLAMINVVGADAQIAVMHWKYTFLFWRPVTAIDPTSVTADGFGPVPGFDDGDVRTGEEAGWRPLLTTPNHPEYPGAHGSITSAVAEVLTEFFDTEAIAVDIHGFDATGAMGNMSATRHFESAAQLREEIIDARLWGGLHYRGSSEAGVDLGQKVAHYDLNHAFRPAR